MLVIVPTRQARNLKLAHARLMARSGQNQGRDLRVGEKREKKRLSRKLFSSDSSPFKLVPSQFAS